jgi:protein-tyrosine phosphatase
VDYLFWLVPGRLAGRPGPDLAPWDLAALRAGGIGAVLSVNEGTFCEPADFAVHDLVYARISLSENAPPRLGDDARCLAALPRAHQFVREQHGAGRAVMVHCTAGKDRTGLFLAYFLVREQGLTPDAAIDEVRRVRPIALTAPGWDDFARELLQR